MLRRTIFVLATILAQPVLAQDVGDGSTQGDLNTNMGNDNVVDSNNATESITNNYNSGPPGATSNPVPSAMAPTMMGGGGNDSCLIPKSQGVQISIIGMSKGEMEQDPECNRRKDARLMGAPQTVGGLGLQVSGISIMCGSPQVFKAMALANTPCPIVDVATGKLLLGKSAYLKMREQPHTYVVGYTNDKAFWDKLLYIGRRIPDVPEETKPSRSLSDQFRSNGRADNDRSANSRRSDRTTASSSQ